MLSSVGGRLEQGEMELLSGWLRAFEPSYVEDNYLDGLGAASMSEEESAAVAAWAQALWTRLVGVSLAPAEGAAALCRAPDAGGVFESTTYGFCLGTPPGYAVVETEPGSFSLVAGGDVMNHVDPRVSIEVTDTGDRTLAQVAAEMAAAYAAPGETLEAQAVSVGGVEGVLFDNLIGQDPNRRLAVVHAGRLYSLMMTPLTPAAEPFYQDVLASLRVVGQ